MWNGPYDDELIDRALLRGLEATPKILAEKNAAPHDLAELLILPLPEREAVLAKTPRFHTYSLAALALEMSEKAVFRDPGLALALTRLACGITPRLDPRAYGGMEAIADLNAYALAREGNAHRVYGDMAVALAAFGCSRKLCQQGGADIDLITRIDLLESSLQRDLRQFDTALALLDRAAEVLLSLGEHERWIGAQVNRANIFLVKEELDKATLILESLDDVKDPQMLLFIRHNLASVLAAAGRANEAREIFEASHNLYLQFPDPLSTNRRLWLEGAIAKELGQQAHAEHLWRKAGTDLAERGYAFDAALIRLDLRKLQTRRRAEPVC